MKQLDSFFLKMHYEESLSEKDKLRKIKEIIDWEKFRPIIGELYDNNSSKGGRPNIDEVVMVKAIVLQTLFHLSDEALEFNMNDRISFQMFIGLDQKVMISQPFGDLKNELRKMDLIRKSMRNFFVRLKRKDILFRKE